MNKQKNKHNQKQKKQSQAKLPNQQTKEAQTVVLASTTHSNPGFWSLQTSLHFELHTVAIYIIYINTHIYIHKILVYFWCHFVLRVAPAMLREP